MRATAFETITPDAPVTDLPTSLRQTPSRAAPFILLAVALPAAVLSLFPFAMIAEHISRDQSLLTQNIGTTIAIGLAGILWLTVFAWPIALRTSRAATRRQVELSNAHVHVTDHRLFGRQSWSEPLERYSGLTHRVRSSLSGTRHELVLVHPNPSRNVLVRASEQISASEIEATAALFGCPEIAPRVIYPTFGRNAWGSQPKLASAA